MDWATLIEFDKQLLLWFNGSDSLFLDGMAKTLTTASTWIPMYLALFLMVLKNNDNIPVIRATRMVFYHSEKKYHVRSNGKIHLR